MSVALAVTVALAFALAVAFAFYVVILSGAKDPEGLDSPRPPGPFQQSLSRSLQLFVLLKNLVKPQNHINR
jgi:hypothetical protein